MATFKSIILSLMMALCSSLITHAQSVDEQVSAILDRSAPAIGKIIVRGSDLQGSGNITKEGTGFFIYSANGSTLLLTAAHVVGSNETDQTKNPDWKVENGKIDRHIEVLSSDEHGSLISRSTNVQVVPVSLGSGIDLSLLMINDVDGFKTLPIAYSIDENRPLRQVLLLGFPERSTSLHRPTPLGFGQLGSPTVYGIQGASSEQGESGGPWIDIHSGTVLAVAHGLDTSGAPTTDSTPVPLVLQSLIGWVPKEQWQAWSEAAVYHAAQGNRSKLETYLKSCQICAYKALAESENASLDAQQLRTQSVRAEADAYRAASGSLEKLRTYVQTCVICEFKVAASTEIASLEVKQQDTQNREKETALYNQARGSAEKLQEYLSYCVICEFKAAAQSEISSIKQQRQVSEAARREARIYNQAKGDVSKLQNYLDSCQICEFKVPALTEIKSIEDQRRQAQAAHDEMTSYNNARGNAGRLRQYAQSCSICEFKAAALTEAASMDAQQRQTELASRESQLYNDARGNVEKLKSYVSSCAICEFKATALSEILSLGIQTCDRTMATQLDTDLPSSAPFVGDTSALSKDETDLAVSSCLAAYQGTNNRRYQSQAGRAYAARARALALASDEQNARLTMQKALDMWNKAAAAGSGAAQNFLGAYYKGTFNTNGISFVTPDYQEALKYWLKGSEAGNAKAMGNAGVMLIDGSEVFPPLIRNAARGKALLEEALQRGNITAATTLGMDLFYGWPPELGKDVAHGLDLLSQACAAGDPGAKEFFKTEMNRDKYRALLPAKAPKGCETDDQQTVSSATIPMPVRASTTQTYWDLNDLIMSLISDGSGRKLYYYRPRIGLENVGVKKGTLFFEGSRSGNGYTGYAYIFSKYCGAAAYAVTGVVSADQRQIKLQGKTPRRNQNCQVAGYTDDPSVLTLRN